MKRLILGRQSGAIALLVVAIVVVWVASGSLGGDEPADETPATSAEPDRDDLVQVRYRSLKAQPITRNVVLHGRTEPARAVTLRAEIEGRVTQLQAARGARVEENELLLTFDVRDREARLAVARAAVRLRELEFSGAKSLQRRELQSETFVAQSFANLERARADLKRIEIEIENTLVRAPFDGVLQERMVEVGDFVQSGDAVARVLELNPIIVAGSVSQNEVHELKLGAQGEASLVTGQQVTGVIRYIAAEGDEATRTFDVELVVPNPDGELLPGVTTEIRIAARTLQAHFVSPAILSLNEADELGIKTLNERDRVDFRPVTIVRARSDGLWVGGLPEQVRVITVGQGFVRPGERVRPVRDERPGDERPGDGQGTDEPRA